MLYDTVGERGTQGEQRVPNEKRTLPFSRAKPCRRFAARGENALECYGILSPRIILDDASSTEYDSVVE
jgi:hypothetical protein